MDCFVMYLLLVLSVSSVGPWQNEPFKIHGRICHSVSDSGEGRGGGKGPGTGCLLFFLEEPGELSAPGFSSTHRPQNSETHPPLGEDSAFIAEYHILPARTREMIFFFLVEETWWSHFIISSLLCGPG